MTLKSQAARPDIIEQLIQLRLRAGISQRELAEELGTQQSAISEWETGVVSVTLTTLKRWAGLFDKEPTLRSRR